MAAISQPETWLSNSRANSSSASTIPVADIQRDPTHAATARTSLLSGNPGAMRKSQANYAALYGTVMPPANAPQPIRNMVDMTDAVAQAAMKKAVEIDALANLELQAALQINQQLQTAAPAVPLFWKPRLRRGW